MQHKKNTGDLKTMALEELELKFGLSEPTEDAIQGMVAILKSFPMIQYGLQARVGL